MNFKLWCHTVIGVHLYSSASINNPYLEVEAETTSYVKNTLDYLDIMSPSPFENSLLWYLNSHLKVMVGDEVSLGDTLYKYTNEGG